MRRAPTMAVLMVAALAAGSLAPLAPAAAEEQGWVTKIAADGSVERIPLPMVRMVDVDPASLGGLQAVDGQLVQARQDEPPAGPADPNLLARERQRPTREVTLYGHVFGSGMLAPQNGEDFGPDGPQAANTVFPVGDANLGLGVFDWCSDAVNAGLGGPLGTPQPNPWSNCDEDPFTKLALFLTAGPVQVHSREEFVYSKLHNERGRTKDVVLDTSQPVTASMWMSLDYHAWSVGNDQDETFCPVGLPPDVGCPYPYWGWDPAYWPQWTVEATLYMVELGEYGQGASEPPPIFEQWQSGGMTVIAQGATEPADITNGLPNSPNVHEFVVNLGPPQVDVIPKTHDVVLVFNFYSLMGSQKVAMHTWRVWAGELFPTKFTLPIKNALDVELVIPQFIHDKLLLHGVIASAFGSYDVDLDSARLTIVGEGSNTPVRPQSIHRVGDYQVSHGAHFKPVNLTWIWDYKADGLSPGSYRAIIEACNFQGSACEQTEARFTIGADLRPTEVVMGRSGQRTVSEGQLRDITSGDNLGTQALPLEEGEPRAQGHPEGGSEHRLPGFEAVLGLAALGAAALLVRRRWD